MMHNELMRWFGVGELDYTSTTAVPQKPRGQKIPIPTPFPSPQPAPATPRS